MGWGPSSGVLGELGGIFLQCWSGAEPSTALGAAGAAPNAAAHRPRLWGCAALMCFCPPRRCACVRGCFWKLWATLQWAVFATATMGMFAVSLVSGWGGQGTAEHTHVPGYREWETHPGPSEPW